MTEPQRRRVWITYAWLDNVEGDFDYLRQELAGVGVEARYDRIELVAGQRLWDQIAERITKGPFDGWAYLITPNSLESEPCREELAYALHRALREKGEAFPLIGLVTSGVHMTEVPPALAVRLCVHLESPDWREEVRAALEGRPPTIPTPKAAKYVWHVHPTYRPHGESPAHPAIEVRPRFGQIPHWRFLVPKTARVIDCGAGPAGGAVLEPMRLYTMGEAEGREGHVNGVPIKWFGAGNALSPSVSAYVVFEGSLPEFVIFSPAREPFGNPDMEEYEGWGRVPGSGRGTS